MISLTVVAESIDTNGALAILHAASDELQQRYGGEADNAHLRVDQLRPPLGIFLVARHERQLVGGVGLRSIADLSLHFAEVKRLWVRPDLRREGIGLVLMNAVETSAKELGYATLYLETGPAQPEALALYRSNGWTEIDQYPAGVFCHPQAHWFKKNL
ncbi:MAG TPA: GNAT family N-acetyltransferase [Acidimicrobiales bacterium]